MNSAHIPSDSLLGSGGTKTQAGTLWGWIDPYLVAVLLFPALLFVVNPNWVFGNYGLDPWVYHGYYRSLPEYLRTFDGAYYGTRLSALVPGCLLYSVFSPLVANAILHTLLTSLSVGALYGTVRELAGRPAGFITALALGAHSCFLHAVGCDYVDSFGVMYCLVTCYLLVRATSGTNWKLLLLLSGGSGACLVVANLAYGLLLPCFVLGFVILNRERQRRSVIASGVFFTLGFVAAVFVLGLIHYRITRHLFFFLGSTEWLAHFWKTTKANPWRLPMSQWLGRAFWLVMPVVASTLSLAVLFFRQRGRLRGAEFPLVQLIALTLLLFGLQTRPHGIMLQLNYYVSVLLLPASFIALGCILGRFLQNLSPEEEKRSVFAGSMLALSSFLATSLIWQGVVIASLWVTFGAVLGIALVLASRIRPSPRIAAGLALVALASVCDFYIRWLPTPGELPQVPVAGPPVLFRGWRAIDPRRAEFEIVSESLLEIKKFDSTGNVWFWFDGRDNSARLFDAIASTHLWGHRLIGREFPQFTPQSLCNGRKVVLLSTGEPRTTEALAVLHSQHLDGKVVGQTVISHSPWTVTVTLIQTFQQSQPTLLSKQTRQGN